ncbi:hypothetical protein D3C71_310470 [compost metagenome]
MLLSRQAPEVLAAQKAKNVASVMTHYQLADRVDLSTYDYPCGDVSYRWADSAHSYQALLTEEFYVLYKRNLQTGVTEETRHNYDHTPYK